MKNDKNSVSDLALLQKQIEKFESEMDEILEKTLEKNKLTAETISLMHGIYKDSFTSKFVDEILGISKISLGLLPTLFLSTYAYPQAPNIDEVRSLIIVVTIVFLAITIATIFYHFKMDSLRLRSSKKSYRALEKILEIQILNAKNDNDRLSSLNEMVSEFNKENSK